MAVGTLRDAHWRDDPHPTLPGKRQRTIRNWMHFREPGGEWQDSAPGLAAMSGPPPGWTGAWDFTRGSQNAALQVWARDAMDAGNRALVGFRASERPSDWINFKALDIAQSVDAQWSADGSTVEWPGLWSHGSLRYTVAAHKAKEEIVLDGPGHAFRWGFSVKLPPGYSLTLTPDGGAAVLDGDGIERLKIQPPTGHDSSTMAPTEDGRQRIECWLEYDAAARPFPELWVCAMESDFAGAVYPAAIDPTTVISGTTDLEDTFIASSVPTFNFGTNAAIGCRGLSPNVRTVVRASTSALPIGSVTSALFSCRKTVNYGAGSITTFAVLQAWSEGQATWNIYKTGSNWGTAGCGLSGTDYESDAAPPTTSLPAALGWYDIALRPSWIERWKSGTLTNNGWRMAVLDPSFDNGGDLSSTEAGSNNPYLTIVYTEAATSKPYYYHFLTRRRRA